MFRIGNALNDGQCAQFTNVDVQGMTDDDGC